MSNPAADLHALFVQWGEVLKDGNHSVAGSRGLDTVRGFAGQRDAMRHLLDLVDGLARLEEQGLPVSLYSKYVPAWTSMLMNFDRSWGSAMSREVAFPSNEMDHLETLIGWFAVGAPRLRGGTGMELRALLEDVSSLLLEDASISDELRLYIRRLVADITASLDDETLGDGFDLGGAAERLWVALFAAAGQTSDPEKKSRWANLATTIWQPSIVGITSSIPGVVVTALGAAGAS
ncbi:hypothetical protein [Frigoribacterium sp. CFBP9030]|uniref:hypothetical protein n=1 Tax=Frigoribacterium sp. CFBP9030 TaxID=3096537 RepID=UPI002A6A946D|nr:hypothetical protein [Frigoribacterium sp. CFBP9030]MDY0892991.1 hypothetical protein [Frigoribacterium sp. CFBP9030]